MRENGTDGPFEAPQSAFQCPAMPAKARRDMQEIQVVRVTRLCDGRFVVAAV